MNAEQYRALVDRIEKIQENHGHVDPKQAAVDQAQGMLDQLFEFCSQQGILEDHVSNALTNAHHALNGIVD